MIHNEHLRKADELYEIRHDMHGNAIHVYVRDKEAIIFATLNDFVQYVYFGDPNIDRYYIDEDDLTSLYDEKSYSYNDLKPKLERWANKKIRKESFLTETITFSHDGRSYTIIFLVQEPDFWVTIDGFDIHYCEDYGDTVVYVAGTYDLIHTQKIKTLWSEN